MLGWDIEIWWAGYWDIPVWDNEICHGGILRYARIGYWGMPKKYLENNLYVVVYVSEFTEKVFSNFNMTKQLVVWRKIIIFAEQ